MENQEEHNMSDSAMSIENKRDIRSSKEREKTMSRKVLIINTGGTLSSVAKEYGLTPGLTTDSMLRELHILAGEAELTTLEYASVDSANIFPEDWANLASLISEKRESVDGIVVIHGTDTLAYTSSMLSFMLQNIRIPVVITGSQLSISNPVADAMENLRCAIYMAQTGCPGVFVAFNRKVMLGCRASKVRALSFDAFDSINCPNVAEISSIGMKINQQVGEHIKIFKQSKIQPHHSDHFISVTVERHSANAGGSSAHRANLVLMEANGSAILIGKYQLILSIRENNIDNCIIGTDRYGYDAICTRTGVVFKARFLHYTVLSTEYDKVRFAEVGVSKFSNIQTYAYSVVAFEVKQVLNCSALCIFCTFGYFVDFKPVTASFLCEEEHRIVHCCGINAFNKVFIACTAQFTAYSASALRSKLRQWCSFDIAEVT